VTLPWAAADLLLRLHQRGGCGPVRLSGSLVTPAHAGLEGASIIFEGAPLVDAVRQHLDTNERLIYIMVKRGSEDAVPKRSYCLRPANNNHVHANGSLDWRPALIIDLAKQ